MNGKGGASAVDGSPDDRGSRPKKGGASNEEDKYIEAEDDNTGHGDEVTTEVSEEVELGVCDSEDEFESCDTVSVLLVLGFLALCDDDVVKELEGEETEAEHDELED